MPTFAELEQAAISRYKSGDVEGAKRLKEQALAQQQHELVAGQAIAAFKDGDVDSAKELKQQALDIIAPYEESTFTDIGRGIKAAPVTVAQGITEFAAAGLDASLGTEYSRPVTEAFEAFKKEHDLDPKTAAGEITEELLGFGLGFIPIAGWLGRASAVAKGSAKTKALVGGGAKSKFFKSAEAFGKSSAGKALLKSRTGLIGTTALSVAGFETIVTPDGRPTMSDAFDVMPLLQTEDTSEMEGFELATTRLKNKAKRGFEGGLASLTFDIGLPVAGVAARSLGTVPGVSGVTSTLARTSSAVFNAVGRQIVKVPGVGASKKFLTEQLSATGTKYGPLAEEILDVDAVGSQAQRTAVRFFSDYEDATNQFFKYVDIEKPRLLRGRGAKDKKQLKKDLSDFLFDPTSDALDGYGKVKGGKTVNKVKDAAARMAKLDSDFQDKIFDELEFRKKLLDDSGQENVALNRAIKDIEEHKASGKGYLRRRFDQYDNSEQFYKALDLDGPAFKAAYTELRTALEGKALKPLTKIQELQVKTAPIDKPITFPAERYTSEELDQIASDKLYEYIGLEGARSLPEAKKMLTELQKTLNLGRNKVIKESRAVGLKDDMFITRIESLDDLPALRALKGEIIDPKKVFLNTISDMSSTLAGLKFYRNAADELGIDLSEGLKEVAEGKLPIIIRSTQAGGKNPTADVSRERAATLLGGSVDPTVVPADDTLKGMGYIRLGEEEAGELPTGVFGGKFGNLTGAYVRPEIKEALTTPARMGLDGMGQAVAIGAETSMAT